MTIESNDYAHRLDALRACGAKHIWLSLEPLLGPVDQLDFRGVDWCWFPSQPGRHGGRACEGSWFHRASAGHHWRDAGLRFRLASAPGELR